MSPGAMTILAFLLSLGILLGYAASLWGRAWRAGRTRGRASAGPSPLSATTEVKLTAAIKACEPSSPGR